MQVLYWLPHLKHINFKCSCVHLYPFLFRRRNNALQELRESFFLDIDSDAETFCIDGWELRNQLIFTIWLRQDKQTHHLKVSFRYR